AAASASRGNGHIRRSAGSPIAPRSTGVVALPARIRCHAACVGTAAASDEERDAQQIRDAHVGTCRARTIAFTKMSELVRFAVACKTFSDIAASQFSSFYTKAWRD